MSQHMGSLPVEELGLVVPNASEPLPDLKGIGLVYAEVEEVLAEIVDAVQRAEADEEVHIEVMTDSKAEAVLLHGVEEETNSTGMAEADGKPNVNAINPAEADGAVFETASGALSEGRAEQHNGAGAESSENQHVNAIAPDKAITHEDYPEGIRVRGGPPIPGGRRITITRNTRNSCIKSHKEVKFLSRTIKVEL